MRQTDFSPAYFGPTPTTHIYSPYSYHTQQYVSASLTSIESNGSAMITGAGSHDEDIWRHVERRMYAALETKEHSRRQCAYCGLNEDDSPYDETGKRAITLGRCYGCQVTYYCSQEHQHLDWLQSHMPRCAELEWAALCELVQATQIALPLPGAHQFWPVSAQSVATWTDWFEIRGDLVKCAHLVAKSMEQHLWRNGSSGAHLKLNRREPAASELVDGLLAQITDSMTYALTLGDALKRY